MACKIPLLVSFDKDSKLWKLINKTNSGFCVEPNDINGMKNLILEIYRNNTKLVGLGENGFNYVKKYLDKKVKVDEYLKLFRIN
jgi:glycosyltransferase involved in cell wall biosynthesis